jgi:hypothetical protein
MQVKISKEISKELLKKIEELNLSEYYNFDEEEFSINSLKGLEELKKLLTVPQLLHYNEEKNAFCYRENDEGEWIPISEVKGINNFDTSDVEISGRLLPIDGIFINSAIGDISKEMECFYITINIAGCFEGRFKKKFLKTLDAYDFDKWEGPKNALGEIQNFDQLYKDFQKVSTMKMRMLSSACSYKLKEKKSEPLSFQTRGLPQDVVSDLVATQNKIKSIRLRYEIGELSNENRKKMQKFQILAKINDMNIEIEKEIEKLQEKNLLELWKIFRINAEYIDEESSQRILDAAQEIVEEGVINNDGRFSEEEIKSVDYLKKFRSFCERKCKNAFVLKLKEEQIEAWNNDKISFKCIRKK